MRNKFQDMAYDAVKFLAKYALNSKLQAVILIVAAILFVHVTFYVKLILLAILISDVYQFYQKKFVPQIFFLKKKTGNIKEILLYEINEFAGSWLFYIPVTAFLIISLFAIQQGIHRVFE